MKKTFLLFVPILLINIYLHFLYFKSSVYQTILINDLSQDLYSLDINDVEKINSKYPTLAINTFPIATFKARYFLHYNNIDKALSYSNIGIENNPYLADTYYIKSRILINDNRLNESLKNLREAYKLSKKKDYIAALYFTVLAELGLKEELTENYRYVKLSNNNNIWRFYLSAIKSLTL